MIAGLLAAASNASAVNITIPDNNGPGAPVNKPLWGWDGGPTGQAAEDNETEHSTSRGQIWDLEAFAVDQGPSISTAALHIIGGYDFALGEPGGRPGHLFINIGGAAPYAPTASAGTVRNGFADNSVGYATPYNYDYAIDLSGVLSASGGSTAVKVYDLNAQSLVATVINDNFGSNPWKLFENNSSVVPTSVTPYGGSGSTPNYDGVFNINAAYNVGKTSAQVGTMTGVTGLIDDNTPTDLTPGASNATVSSTRLTDLHNVLTLDLGWLVSTLTPGTQVYFSYTMECGNDSLKGVYTVPRVPDAGSSMALLGIGASALGLIRRRQVRVS